MYAARIRGALSLLATATVVACGSGTEPNGGNPGPASAVSIVSGNGQVGLAGQVLSVPLVVKVTADGSPIRGAAVAFAVASGAATLAPATATTDTSGQAKTLVTLGVAPGSVTITATVTGTALVATFVATIGSANTVLACASGAANTPSAGSVLPNVGGTGVCLGGGTSGAEYAVVAFYGNTDATTTQSFSVTGKGATAVTSASSVATMAASLDEAGGATLLRPASRGLRAAFDAQLRETARRELTPLMPAARAQQRQAAAAFNVIPSNPTIGSLVTLNANGIQACTALKNRVSRIAAVSNNAIIVADTANPAGGFTDAEYASFATMFDTLINPLDVAAFGTPSDIDRNNKIVIFFTKEVNALTPRTGADGTIGGFFFERDLFPLTTQNGLDGCPGSNLAEMFYVLVPDPQGVYSRAHTKQDVLSLTPATIAHEYQHLINAGRRLYVNNAFEFEVTWLNEGLSHIAEELLYYKVAGLAPRQNIGAGAFANQAAVDAFNNYQADNSGRYEIFIGKPNLTSVFDESADVALETRGAAWNLLRYLADHRGASDGDAWQRLVNTTLTGHANLASVFGSNHLTQVSDWATSVFADDIPGMTNARFTQPSWNMRSIFPSLCANAACTVRLGRFPLAVIPLSEAAPANVTVDAGGAAYLRFAVAAGGQASIDWSAFGLPVSGLMQFSVIRTK